MTFLRMMFSPHLYKEYGQGLTAAMYEPGGMERWGDKVLTALSVMWNISYYTSPLIVTCLYRRGYFVADSITSLCRISTSLGLLVVISLCIRSFGRSQNRTYVKFMKALEAGTAKNSTEADKEALRQFDFDFNSWPVDFSVNEVQENKYNRKAAQVASSKSKPFWFSSLPCEVAAYVAIHSFGIRLIYPGSMRVLLSYVHPMLVQGRAKMIEVDRARRNKVHTEDGNDIDTIFVDNRRLGAVGNTLVICSEGNAGFYEVGILSTPLAMKFSVLGWNHPGFAGSTGRPYPDQDKNAINAVIQFAIHKLGFLPEQIILFGWSIGGYSSIYVATLYPEIKGLVLDATFDDLLQLALPRMPQCISGIVRIAIRQYFNLNNTELINSFSGPVMLVRRTEDEVISDDMNPATNRGNFLLLSMLKMRYPNIYTSDQIQIITNILRSPLEQTDDATDQLSLTLLVSDATQFGKVFPSNIGIDFTEEQRTQIAQFLLRKHMIDFKSSHCTPLPTDYFQLPWSVPVDEDAEEYVFT